MAAPGGDIEILELAELAASGDVDDDVEPAGALILGPGPRWDAAVMTQQRRLVRTEDATSRLYNT